MWTSVNDLIDAWVGDNVPTNERLVTEWIGKAERLLRREFPTLQARIIAGQEPDLLDTVKDVVVAMVTRVLRNPEGQRTFNKTAGPYSESVTYGGDMPGSLFLTEMERASLREPDLAGRGKAYSISLASVSYMKHLPWCGKSLTGGRCSCGVDIAGEPIYEKG